LINTIQKSIKLLSIREQKQGYIVVVLATGMAILETFSMISVMPFLAVLGDPDVVTRNVYLSEAFSFSKRFGVEHTEDFLILLGCGAFFFIVLSAVYKLYTFYITNKFIGVCQHGLSTRLFELYLLKPYSYYITRHSADMSKNVLSQIEGVIGMIYRPLYTSIGQIFVLIGIVLFLIFFDPLIAISTAFMLGGLYSTFFLIIKKKLKTLGNDVVVSNNSRFKVLGEAFSGIKEIKYMGCESIYLNRFENPSQTLAKAQATNLTLSVMPKHLIEALAFGGLIGVTLSILVFSGGHGNENLGKILPIIGVYAFAAYRLQPAIQTVLSTLMSLKFGQTAIDDLYADLFSNSKVSARMAESFASTDSLRLNRHVALRNILFSYPGAIKPSLYDISLEFPIGSITGIVGTTGSGKTTLIDVLLGLLIPNKGQMIVDDKVIGPNEIGLWQKKIGYVPQQTHIYDATIAENIAFGVPFEKIDHGNVERCARMAQVHDFVCGLPDKYLTKAGENGIRFSGGQRQRIGIARALYREADVLVFDEATSALDSVTEKSIMESIKRLSKNKAIILVAHRLSTVKNCDQIVLLEEGRVLAKGLFEVLFANRKDFKKLAGE
jgi:ATP-binding cassette, subfamily B, bacterial PglK